MTTSSCARVISTASLWVVESPRLTDSCCRPTGRRRPQCPIALRTTLLRSTPHRSKAPNAVNLTGRYNPGLCNIARRMSLSRVRPRSTQCEIRVLRPSGYIVERSGGTLPSASIPSIHYRSLSSPPLPRSGPLKTS